jgi:hypothetical protein
MIALMAILAFPASIHSKTIHVPGDYNTIQEAIDAAVNGDKVLVHPGTYVENIDFKGKAITVTGEQGHDVTIIDGNQAGSVVTCQSGEDENSVLDGFTVLNGSGTYISYILGGGGMINQGSSPTVTNCTFIGNSALHAGGGMDNLSISPIVTNCILWDNKPDQVNGVAATITYCCVQGGYPGTSNIDSDPLFVDSSNGDCHLTFSSPCKNTGNIFGSPDVCVGRLKVE